MSKYSSSLQFYVGGMLITVKMVSPNSRKYRRAVLLMLYRSSKEKLREMRLLSLTHSDDPFTTYLNQVIRGVIAPDALKRETLHENFGFMIRTLRTRIGLTQKEFAKRAQTTQAFISQVEHGKRKANPEFLIFISELLSQSFPALSEKSEHFANLQLQLPENFPRNESRVRDLKH